VAGIAALRWYRNRQFSPGYRFVFEDLADPAVRTLGISHGVKHNPDQDDDLPPDPGISAGGPGPETWQRPAAAS
jgi:hypothetical protein